MRLPSAPPIGRLLSRGGASGRRLPILFVGPDAIEWWLDGSQGQAYHLEASFGSQRPEEIVEAALEVLLNHRAAPRQCLLALSSELGGEALLHLPELNPTETREVLNRRAVQLLDCDPADVLYHAVPMAEDVGGADASGRSWLLYAQRRSVVLGIQVELRRRGVSATRAVIARSAFAARAAGAAAQFKGESDAWLFVGVERNHTVFGLGSGDQLLLQSVLETGLGSGETTAMLGLIQELRNLSAWWRKRSRGQGLGAIVTIGLERDLAASMEPALRAAFGAVEFVHVEEPRSKAMMARVATLGACRTQHALTCEVTQPLPISTRALGAVTLTTVLLCVLIGSVLQGRWVHRLDEADNELARMRYLGSEARSWQAEVDSLEARKDSLERLTEELEGLSRRGIPLEALLHSVDQAFAGDAHLSTLTVGEGEAGFQVRMSAKAMGDPDQAADVLAAVQGALTSGNVFATPPSVLPPTALPTRDDGTELVFSVEGELIDHGREAQTAEVVE